MSQLLRPDEMPRAYNQQSMWQIISRIADPLSAFVQGLFFTTIADSPITASTEIPRSVDFVPVDATSGAITVTLPDADECIGKRFTVKKIDTTGYRVTVDVKSGGTIDDETTQVICSAYTSLCFMSANDAWWIV